MPRPNGLSNASEKWQEYRVTKKSVAIQHEWKFEVEFSLGSTGANVRGMERSGVKTCNDWPNPRLQGERSDVFTPFCGMTTQLVFLNSND